MPATVTMLERLGNGQESESSYLHVLSADVFSGSARNYANYAIRVDASGVVTYSMERWVRWRFEPPFTQVEDVRFWTPNLVVPEGWTLLYGSTDDFSIPTNAPSSIAVHELPTSKPAAPNAGGVPPLQGTDTRYSKWIVLQASADDDAEIGPMLGFEDEDPVGIGYRLDWTES